MELRLIKESYIVLAYYLAVALITASTPLRNGGTGYDLSLWLSNVMATFIPFCY